MLSIIRNKLNIVIILMVVFELNTGTEPENDWFSQYGAERDAGDGILQDGMEEGEGEGILKQKKHVNMIIIYFVCLMWLLLNFLSQLVMTAIGPRGSTAASMTRATASTGALMSTVALGLSTMAGPTGSLSGLCPGNLIYINKGL